MSTRRDFIKHLSMAAGVGAVASLGLGLNSPRIQAALASNWWMPDEAHPHKTTYISFGASPIVWKDWLGAAQNTVGLLANTIAKFEHVTVLCRPEELALAKQKCGTKNIRFLTVPLDDVWMRDFGANFVIDGQGGLGAVDYNFSGWGGKQHHANDDKVAAKLACDTSATHIRSQLTGEGGGIEVDGHGTAIMTESCWINDNRNPGLSKAQIEAELKANLGLRKIIWLPGIRGMDITDAHVDFYARFTAPGVVLASLDNNPESYDHAVTHAHLEILQNATDADGRKLVVHTVEPPMNGRNNKYTREFSFAPGYINYILVKGGIIAPQFGDPLADGTAKAKLQQLYPGRSVVQINIDPIAGGGGGIHCITHQLPLV